MRYGAEDEADRIIARLRESVTPLSEELADAIILDIAKREREQMWRGCWRRLAGFAAGTLAGSLLVLLARYLMG